MISQPAELAIAVAKKLNNTSLTKSGKEKKPIEVPPTDVLALLFSTLFFASIKTEEGRSIQVRVFYMDPNDPDPDVPPLVRVDRWSIFTLKEYLDFTVATLVKLAKAADPWSSGIAVFHNQAGKLFVWGLVDQVVAISMAIVQESPATYPPPGIFHALVNGPADITVFRQMSFIARMAQDSLIEGQNDCLWEGPVSDIVDEWFKPIWDDVSSAVPREALSWWRPHWRFETKRMWTTTLSRILINIQRQRHGGAILFCPSSSRADLSIKYGIDYPKVAELLRRILFNQIQLRYTRQKLEWRAAGRRTAVPYRLYSDERYFEYQKQDAEQALTGAVRFISSMAGIDGLVLLAPRFVVEGFGVEITTKSDVSELTIISSADGRSDRVGSPSHYGTRHRSMFRYCFANPGSLGFVVSQDGDIRAVTSISGKVLLFENVKIHSLWDDDFPKMLKGISPKRTKTKK